MSSVWMFRCRMCYGMWIDGMGWCAVGSNGFGLYGIFMACGMGGGWVHNYNYK